MFDLTRHMNDIVQLDVTFQVNQLTNFNFMTRKVSEGSLKSNFQIFVDTVFANRAI